MRCKLFLAAIFLLFMLEFVPAPYIYSVSWNMTEVMDGQQVKLIVEGEGLIGHPISFKIFEKNQEGSDTLMSNPPSTIVFNNKTSNYYTFDYALWNAVYQDDTYGSETDPPEYYFAAQVADRAPDSWTYVQSSTKYEDLLKVYPIVSGPGAIWTTNGDCGDIDQDINHFARGEHVYINGAGFEPGVYNWDIIGGPGGSSGDPGIQVASGTHNVGQDGTFCLEAYRVALDDWGEYNVDFGDKNDNYRVDPNLPIVGDCKLTNVYWDVTTAFEGEMVIIKVMGTEDCDGDDISFIVKEKDAFPNLDDDVKINPLDVHFDSSRYNHGYWIAEAQDNNDEEGGQTYPPEYYFMATVASTGEKLESSNLLEVLNRDITCAGINYCSDYLNQLDCERDNCEVGEDSVPTNINCGETLFNPITECWDNTNCGCFWNITLGLCEGGWEVDSRCFCTTNDECWLVGGLCQDDCTCFGNSIPDGEGSCDYTPGVCNTNDECWLAGDKCNEDCTCEERYEPNGEGSCGQGYPSPGTCFYTDTTPPYDCQEGGVFVRTQSAQWIWAPGNEISMYDPLGKHLQCVDIEEVFVCPSSVEVPFFGTFNIIIVIAITSLIYLGYSINNKKRKENSTP